MGWLIVVAVVLVVLGRAWWHVRMWAWRVGQREPQARLEAEILWHQYRRVKR